MIVSGFPAAAPIRPTNFLQPAVAKKRAESAEGPESTPPLAGSGENTTSVERPVRQPIVDELDLSSAAQQRLAAQDSDDDSAPGGGNQASADGSAAGADESEASADESEATANGNDKSADGDPLTEEEREQVEWLSNRDREVRTHEQAHLTAAGPYARGGPSYTFQTGPDGRQYAIGGEVQIDTSPVDGDPEATARKARIVRAAALAPAEPSGQDRKVAAQAAKMEREANAEIQRRNNNPEERDESAKASSSGTDRSSSYDESDVQVQRGQFFDAVA